MIVPLSVNIGVGQRAVCHWGDEVDWHLTQTGVVKEGLDTLQEVIDHTLDPIGKQAYGLRKLIRAGMKKR